MVSPDRAGAARERDIVMRTSALRLITVVAVVAASAASAWAKPELVVSIASTKEVASVKNGKRTTRVVPAKSAAPGDVVTYTLSYVNKGDEAATDAVIDDPIPTTATYVANSATGAGSEITFSNDGGKTYAAPVMLFYDYTLPSKKVERRVATPDQYTHVRWTVKRVPPGAKGEVSFKVRVK
jgi:uncharacterized repeat protein (TIGR01451 family)